MFTNLTKHQQNLDCLVARGRQLIVAMKFNESRGETQIKIVKDYGDDAEEIILNLPKFKCEYQTWYTEARMVVRQVIPDRFNDFIQQYDRPNRKVISVHNYTIDDYLNRLKCWEFVIVTLGIARMEQQVEILRSAQQRFEGSFFDLRRSIAVELSDREIVAARDLFNGKFFRAAGAMAGVCFEKHLWQVCQNHVIEVPKKSTTGDLNELLKKADVIELSQFRENAYLLELRALCIFNKTEEPKEEQVLGLIDGVEKALKTML